MVLVDTSVWVHHLRFGEPGLAKVLLDGEVLMHPFVIGEIACGNMRKRTAILSDLERLPKAICAEHHEVLGLIEFHHLYGTGLGWVDAHLLASALLSRSVVWTLDRGLAAVAAMLHLKYQIR